VWISREDPSSDGVTRVSSGLSGADSCLRRLPIVSIRAFEEASEASGKEIALVTSMIERIHMRVQIRSRVLLKCSHIQVLDICTCILGYASMHAHFHHGTPAAQGGLGLDDLQNVYNSIQV
jgi:hypothetical protein